MYICATSTISKTINIYHRKFKEICRKVVKLFIKNLLFQVLYTSQQPKQVQIGLTLPSGATISELRAFLESDTSIDRANMLITEIDDYQFLRTFSDSQYVSILTEYDPIYCIEVPHLKDLQDNSTSAYILLCWINVVSEKEDFKRFSK